MKQVNKISDAGISESLPRLPKQREQVAGFRILFLTLKTFSATGGIEKFNRCFAKALAENAKEHGWKFLVCSAYDEKADESYLPTSRFLGFSGRRVAFFLEAVRQIALADTIIFGHINLAPLVKMTGLLYPSRKKICIAHGREVWQDLSRIQRKALQILDEVWCVSQFTTNILVRKQAFPAAKARFFPNTLDPFFASDLQAPAIPIREKYGIRPDEKVILTVARLAGTEKFKGYDLVLQLMPDITRQLPGTRYVLCGKWDEPEKKRISGLINELKLHNLVILTGFIEDFELVAHYRMADLFVLPSRKEGFGIVFLEAAWCGLPVIAGNRDGSSEALLHGKLGRLVDPENPQQLLEAITGALTTPLTAPEQENRRDLISTWFGFDQFKKRQAALLKKVMV